MYGSKRISVLIITFIIISSFSILNYVSCELDWTKQCSRCTCIWVSGRKTANCSGRGYTSIPNDLSNEVRDIDFSSNILHGLGDMEFAAANLYDIHKLKFQNCSIETIHENAFRNLRLLIELDLSRNSITRLKQDTFKELIKIRIVNLSYNRIKTLAGGLFENLIHLQRIHLDHNEIESINSTTFQQLPSLSDINLGYNRLQTINFDLKEGLPKLNSLSVEENPWLCDCNLEKFRRSVTSNNLITQTTKCAEPQRIHGVSWFDTMIFACAPLVEEILPGPLVEVTSKNITLKCKATGVPPPDVDWYNNGHIVEKDPRKMKQRYYTSKTMTTNNNYDDYEKPIWNNLTITNLSYKDRGDYRCIAKNPGGEDGKNVTLLIDSEALLGSYNGLSIATILVISLSIGLVILFVIILILAFLFCRRSNRQIRNSKRRDLGGSSDECISMDGHADIKKGYITEVNPVTKPPRATTVPSGVVSGGTEVSEVKKNLLDNDSYLDADDESRSLDFDQPLLRKSHNALIDSDYRFNNAPYPPDLLPFPPAGPQLSPAGSIASTVVIDSRLPAPHGPQSPLHAASFCEYPNLYKTLPYSRSHNPFGQSPAVPRIPRQGAGYVTIPRRPRQSWSSEPPPNCERIGDPLYDNLGIRTTADGSSVLSLNKIGNDSITPRPARILSPKLIDPIVETHEIQPSQSQQQLESDKMSSSSTSGSLSNNSNNNNVQPKMPVTKIQPSSKETPMPATATAATVTPATLVVRKSPDTKLSPPIPPVKPATPIKPLTLPRSLTPSRTQWALNNAEQFRSPSEKRNSIATTDGSGANEGKPKKIPPRPPPKPKKRTSTGPLFEDEGEDGTEV